MDENIKTDSPEISGKPASPAVVRPLRGSMSKAGGILNINSIVSKFIGRKKIKDISGIVGDGMVLWTEGFLLIKDIEKLPRGEIFKRCKQVYQLALDIIKADGEKADLQDIINAAEGKGKELYFVPHGKKREDIKQLISIKNYRDIEVLRQLCITEADLVTSPLDSLKELVKAGIEFIDFPAQNPVSIFELCFMFIDRSFQDGRKKIYVKIADFNTEPLEKLEDLIALSYLYGDKNQASIEKLPNDKKFLLKSLRILWHKEVCFCESPYLKEGKVSYYGLYKNFGLENDALKELFVNNRDGTLCSIANRADIYFYVDALLYPQKADLLGELQREYFVDKSLPERISEVVVHRVANINEKALPWELSRLWKSCIELYNHGGLDADEALFEGKLEKFFMRLLDAPYLVRNEIISSCGRVIKGGISIAEFVGDFYRIEALGRVQLPGQIWALTVSSDNKFGLCSCNDQKVRIIDLEKIEERDNIDIKATVLTFAHTFVDRNILARCSDGQIKILDMYNAIIAKQMRLEGAAVSNIANDVALFKNATTAIMGHEGGIIAIVNLQNARAITRFDLGSNAVAIYLSPDNAFAAVCCNDNTLRFLEIFGEEKIEERFRIPLPAKVNNVVFSLDNKKAVAVTVNNNIILLDIDSETQTKRIDLKPEVTCIQVLSDLTCALLGYEDGTIRVIILNSGREINKISLQSMVRNIGISNDLNYAIAECYNNNLWVLNLKSTDYFEQIYLKAIGG